MDVGGGAQPLVGSYHFAPSQSIHLCSTCHSPPLAAQDSEFNSARCRPPDRDQKRGPRDLLSLSLRRPLSHPTLFSAFWPH